MASMSSSVSAGQTHHEVELDGAPAAREDLLGHGEQRLGGDVLVDPVAQRVAAGLGREGEARSAVPPESISASSTEKESMRRLGREMETCRPSKVSTMPADSVSISE